MGNGLRVASEWSNRVDFSPNVLRWCYFVVIVEMLTARANSAKTGGISFLCKCRRLEDFKNNTLFNFQGFWLEFTLRTSTVCGGGRRKFQLCEWCIEYWVVMVTSMLWIDMVRNTANSLKRLYYSHYGVCTINVSLSLSGYCWRREYLIALVLSARRILKCLKRGEVK